MTRTEAAETIATDVRAWARQNGREITKDLVEARISEAAAGHLGIYKKVCANNSNPKTVLRLALATI